MGGMWATSVYSHRSFLEICDFHLTSEKPLPRFLESRICALILISKSKAAHLFFLPFSFFLSFLSCFQGSHDVAWAWFKQYCPDHGSDYGLPGPSNTFCLVFPLSFLPFFLCNMLISIISIVINIYLNINYFIGGDNADTCCYQMHIYLKK